MSDIGFFFVVFFISRCAKYFGERSGLHANRPVKHQVSSTTKQCCCHTVDAVCDLALFWWNRQGLPWKRPCLDGSCSTTWIYLSASMVSFQMCKLPIPYALMHPHTITGVGFLTEHWKQARKSLSSLVRRTNFDSSDLALVHTVASWHASNCMSNQQHLLAMAPS